MKKKLFTLMTLLLCLCSGAWGAPTSTHSPGVYTKAANEGGYGQTLTTYSSRQYEIYGFTKTSASAYYCYAGAVTSTSSDANCVLSFNKTTESTNGWIAALVSGNGSSQTTALGTDFNEFSTIGGTNGSGMYFKADASSTLTIKISGYDQFSIVGVDNNLTSGKERKLKVSIDGTEQSMTSSTSKTIRRFDITTDEHTIVISAINNNNSDGNSQVYAFSLRIPSAATHTVTLDDNGEYQGNGSAKATEESATLTNITAPKRDGYSVEGYYDDALYILIRSLQPQVLFSQALLTPMQTASGLRHLMRFRSMLSGKQ